MPPTPPPSYTPEAPLEIKIPVFFKVYFKVKQFAKFLIELVVIFMLVISVATETFAALLDERLLSKEEDIPIYRAAGRRGRNQRNRRL